MANIKDLIAAVEKLAPSYLAEEWDNVGLQIGVLDKEVKKVLLALDVNIDVINEAISLGADLIFSHHPLIRQGINSITGGDPVGDRIISAIKNNLAILVAHTNLDKTVGGVSDRLAERLGLIGSEPLIPEKKNQYKLAVFIPVNAVSEVKRAIGDAGAGKIGNYSHCLFASPGTGSFKPLSGARPAIGEVGKIEEVEEVKLEAVVRKDRLAAVVEAMLAAHQYEEVAYDIYPVENDDKEVGIGRLGKLPAPSTLEDFLNTCREQLDVEPRVAGDTVNVNTVAVCGGSGADLISTARERGADLLVTGDVKFHDAQLAKELGFCVIDCGHDASEKVVLKPLKSYLETEMKGRVEILVSEIATHPWRRDV